MYQYIENRNFQDFIYSYNLSTYKYNFGLINHAIPSAIENNNLDIIKYLSKYEIEIDFNINLVLIKLDETDVLKILKLLMSLGYNIYEYYCITESMASKGYKKVL